MRGRFPFCRPKISFMRVRSIYCENFRNFEQLSLEFGKRSNRFCGKNAQGKTNLLEAIFLCGCARSHRTGRDSELIRQGESSYLVKLVYELDNGSVQEIQHVYRDFPKPERKISHNGFPLERIADLYGLFQAVIFAPEDLSLVKDGPAERRRYLDMLISRISPSYFKDLQYYQNILFQRNNLLKQLRQNGAFTARRSSASKTDSNDELGRKMQRLSLDIWNEKLAECAARIMAKRYSETEKILFQARQALKQISAGDEELDIQYRTSLGIIPEASIEQIQKQLMRQLERSEEDDILRGATSRGPHRDDLEISINSLPVRIYASQGQQRSVVLALKLAELKLLETACEEKPVLLLDDVLSELDQERRKSLLTAVQTHQVFMTCTDHDAMDFELSDDPEDSRSFLVKDGHFTVLDESEGDS